MSCKNKAVGFDCCLCLARRTEGISFSEDELIDRIDCASLVDRKNTSHRSSICHYSEQTSVWFLHFLLVIVSWKQNKTMWVKQSTTLQCVWCQPCSWFYTTVQLMMVKSLDCIGWFASSDLSEPTSQIYVNHTIHHSEGGAVRFTSLHNWLIHLNNNQRLTRFRFTEGAMLFFVRSRLCTSVCQNWSSYFALLWVLVESLLIAKGWDLNRWNLWSRSFHYYELLAEFLPILRLCYMHILPHGSVWCTCCLFH